MILFVYGIIMHGPSLTVPVSTLAGSGAAESSNGIGSRASINAPKDVALSRSGTFAVATEAVGHRVRLIDLATSQVTTLAGSGNNQFVDGTGTQASFSAPEGIAISPDGSFTIVVEGSTTSSHRVRHIMIATGVVTTLAGNGAGYSDGVGTFAKFNQPRGIALSPDGTYALITDELNFRVRRLDIASNTVTTVAGSSQGFSDGLGTNAKFYLMFQLAIDPTGSFAVICDHANHRIRRLDIVSLQVTTLAGSGAVGFRDGDGISAMFDVPAGVAIDPTGVYVLIADWNNHRVRRIVFASAQVTTLAGTGTPSTIDGAGAQATFGAPHAISIDVSGTFALVADARNNRIRRIALTSPPCNAGFFCPMGSSSPTQAACPIATYCPADSFTGAPHTCNVGSYCSSTGLTAPIPCPPGYACVSAGLSNFTVSCSAGYYCPSGSSSATQVPCPAGFYCPPGAANGTAFPCSAGKYCPAASSALDQGGPCTAGFYCLAGADRVSCAAGTFSASGQTVCTDCSAGTFQKYAGQANCSACARGTTSTARAQFCTGAFCKSLSFVQLCRCERMHFTLFSITCPFLSDQAFLLSHAPTLLTVRTMHCCVCFDPT
jgi:DNA-binding beta-propeller fold protein YncE